MTFFRPFLFLAAMLLSINLAHAVDRSGTFRGEAGEQVRGTAQVVEQNGKTVIKLGGGFRSSSGPDLFVFVGNGSPQRQVAKLRRNNGSQTYTLPAGISPSQFSTVFIHCKRYNHIFGRAKLR